MPFNYLKSYIPFESFEFVLHITLSDFEEVNCFQYILLLDGMTVFSVK